LDGFHQMLNWGFVRDWLGFVLWLGHARRVMLVGGVKISPV
jgi:hypothetical protein